MAVRRSLAWMAASQGLSFTLQFAASIVVARFLSPYELGVYAIAVATVGVLVAFQALGLGNLIVRERELSDDMVSSIYTINSLMAVCLSIAIVIVAIAGGFWIKDNHVRDVLLVMSPAPLCALVDFLPAAHFEREGNFRAVSIGTAIRSVANAALTIIFAVLGFKFIGLALAQDLSVLITAVYFGWVGRRFLSFRLGLSQWRHVISCGLQLLTVSGLTSLFQRGADVVLGGVLGISALGIFNRASSLNSLILDKVRITIERIIFSHMSSRLRNKESLEGVYLYTVDLMTAVLWPAFGGLAVVSGPLVHAMYGAKWQGAAAPLAFLAVGSIVQVSISLSWELFILRNELARQSKIEFIRTLIGFSVFAMACKFGLVAAAVARIADAVVANFLYRKEIERMTDTTIAQYLPIYARSLLLTIFAVVPGIVIQMTDVFGSESPFLTVSISVIVGVCSWALGVVLVKHQIAHEILQPLRRLRAQALN